jgi:splicing factor 3A subunit 2
MDEEPLASPRATKRSFWSEKESGRSATAAPRGVEKESDAAAAAVASTIDAEMDISSPPARKSGPTNVSSARKAPSSSSSSLGRPLQLLVESPAGGRTHVVNCRRSDSYRDILARVVDAITRPTRSGKRTVDDEGEEQQQQQTTTTALFRQSIKRQKLSESVYLVHRGKVLPGADDGDAPYLGFGGTGAEESPHFVQLRMRIAGGMDRQNRVGSKFGGGGQSSYQQAERERKDRLRKLALESIDLAKDPYLVRNHLGGYECKLCLTLHRDEANYLAHTQGKKHQQGLARRAHLDRLKREREGGALLPTASTAATGPSVPSAARKVRIGRPAYQVFKSRDADTNQRCLSFELQYPEIEEDLQPRHRFMSAFEQRVESPPDRNYQYLLFAAEPYETVAFKIPNEPIDKGEDRFVTHWDADTKKFTLTLYFV